MRERFSHVFLVMFSFFLYKYDTHVFLACCPTGRGGSDLTATSIGAACNLDEIQGKISKRTLLKADSIKKNCASSYTAIFCFILS